MITVIIGTDNSGRALAPTLAALVAGAAAGAVREVIVADAGSTDPTVEIADMAGCEFIVSKAPLALRLQEAAGRARAAWLMFLRPGVVLDQTWIEEANRFVEHVELSGQSDARAAVFRRAPSIADSRPLLLEALGILISALSRRPHPEQGLLISKRFYEQLGGHRVGITDAETDLLARLGRKRTIMLRSAAVKVTNG
ncbi:MAG: glycosyl transferase [Bradyrhizobiaceae bacterium]|nr:glycosyl transferase [Bradyrhizobiaceae bacterium]